MMENTNNVKDLSITKALKLLRDGFKHELASYILSDERTTELLHELITEFVDKNIPLIGEELKLELSMMMLETLDLVAR
jgi:hypothetical protein